VEFGLLGPLRVTSHGRAVGIRAGGQRTLLAVLLLRANRPVPAEDLIDRLWERMPPPKAKAALHAQVARLRQALGQPDLIRTESGGYRIRVAADELDLTRFDDLSRRAGESTDPAEQADLLRAALALWRGPALVDVVCESLHREVVPALSESHSQALQRRIDADLRLGRHAEVIAELRTLTVEQPLRERFWAQLMVALYRSGQQGEALAAYRTVRRILVDVLGVEPGAELRRLERGVLSGDPQWGQPEPAAPAAATAAWTPQHQLPREVTGMVGRDDLVHDLVGRLTAVGGVPVVAIHGSAGVGKSTLALRVAHLVTAEFPDGQWFVRLDGADRGGRAPVDILGELLLAAGMPEPMIPRGQSARASTLRARLAGRRVLLLLDDAAGPEQVEDLMPGTQGSAVLITSRRELSGLAVRHGSYGLPLPVLSAEAGAALLGDVLGPQRAAAEPGPLAELVELCARLPLALRIAAANLSRYPQRSIDGYVALLRDGDRLSRLAVPGDPQAAVRAAFDLSYRGFDPVAARAFRLLGLIAGPELTVEAMAVLLGGAEPEAERLLETLATASLITRGDPGRYQFHDLLRLYALERAHAEDGPERTAQDRRRLVTYQLGRIDRAIGLLYPVIVRLDRPAGPPDRAGDGFADQRAALAWLDRERVNLVAAARQAAIDGPAELTWHLADALRAYLSARFHNDDWENLARAGLAAAETAGDLAARTAMHHSLGVLHSNKAEYAQAQANYQRAIELREAAGTPAANGPTYNNLGVVYTSRGMNDEAIQSFRRGIALDEARGFHTGQAHKLSNLATVLYYTGDLTGALEHLRRSETIRDAAGLAQTPHLYFTRGQCLHRLGDTATAAAELAQALSMARQIGEDMSAAYALYATSDLLGDLGDLDGAAEHAAAALDLARTLHSPATEMDALTVSGMAQRRLGDRRQAIALHTRALELAQRTGELRGGVFTRIGLATALLDLRHRDPAAHHLQAALATARRCRYRLFEAQALAVLARLHREAGATADAAAAVQQASAIHRVPPGPDGAGRPPGLTPRRGVTAVKAV
jgi:DNA-binding SARP family transcriptional activator/tetratricopeptide (TPR) repeat protein